MTDSTGSNKTYNILRPRTYDKANGEKKTQMVEVGVAWELKDGKEGMRLHIYDGVSVTGDCVILPRKEVA